MTIAAACLLVFALLAAASVLRPLLRWIARIVVAGIAALASALVLPLSEDEYWVPLVVFVGALVILASRRHPKEPRSEGPGVRMPLSNQALPRNHSEWAELRKLVTWREKRRIDAAQDKCDRYLALAEDNEDLMSGLPIRITKRLPELASECLRNCRTAPRDEQRQLIAQTIESLEVLAASAEQRRMVLAHDAQGRFRSLRAHLSRSEE